MHVLISISIFFLHAEEYVMFPQETKRTVIGYFEKQDSPEYEMFRKIAVNLKDDCQFLAGFGWVSLAQCLLFAAIMV